MKTGSYPPAGPYFTNTEVAEFLSGGLRWLTHPLTVIWDGGGMHHGDPINELVAESKGRLVVEWLPADAPKLNPVEQVWTGLKYSRLCNVAPQDAPDLNAAIISTVSIKFVG